VGTHTCTRHFRPRGLAHAQADKRILITFDKDFGELAFRYGLPATCGVILLRIAPSSAARIAQVADAALASRTDWANHFSVIEDDRIRMTPLGGADTKDGMT